MPLLILLRIRLTYVVQKKLFIITTCVFYTISGYVFYSTMAFILKIFDDNNYL